jgi:hypothetical protein
MPTTAEDIFGVSAPETVEVTPAGATKPVRLRVPTFKEWHGITIEHRKCGAAQTDPPADLIARTIAICVADSQGKRKLTDTEAAALLEASPRQVMDLYTKCWETVLRNDDDAIQEEAKN